MSHPARRSLHPFRNVLQTLYICIYYTYYPAVRAVPPSYSARVRIRVRRYEEISSRNFFLEISLGVLCSSTSAWTCEPCANQNEISRDDQSLCVEFPSKRRNVMKFRRYSIGDTGNTSLPNIPRNINKGGFRVPQGFASSKRQG